MTGQVAQVSGWEITSTIATASAAVIALTVVVANSLQRRADELRRRREEEARALAQARLVITATGNPGVRPLSDDASGLDGRRSVMEFPFANHGDRPVLDVYGEVWPSGVAITDRPMAVHAEVVLAGEHIPLRVQLDSAPEQVQVGAWRVRWTDADGRQWYRDRFPQEAPERFTGGPPHRY